MQEPIRYYITKCGEEPTVRSVKVAVSPADLERPRDLEAPADESPAVPRPRPGAEEERAAPRQRRDPETAAPALSRTPQRVGIARANA